MDEIKPKLKEAHEFIKKYWKNIMVGMIIFLIIIIYFTVFFRRVHRSLRGMREYAKQINLQPIVSNEEIMNGNFKLCDFYVASSAKSYLPKSQTWDYSSVNAIEWVLRSGARYIELDIHPNGFCIDSQPVVCNGIEIGNYSYTTKLCLEDCIARIRDIAFNPELGNHSDPLFLCLNIYCDSNWRILEKVADSLERNLSNRLLDPQYNWRTTNLAQTPIKELINKCVIISNSAWEGSPMEEYINFSNEISSLRVLDHTQIANTFDQKELRDFNCQNLTLVYPGFPRDQRSTDNYNPVQSWLLGCQFVLMNYQESNPFMDLYIDKFKNSSFILKPEGLRYKPKTYPSPIPQNPAVSFAPRQTTTPFYSITY